MASLVEASLLGFWTTRNLFRKPKHRLRSYLLARESSHGGDEICLLLWHKSRSRT